MNKYLIVVDMQNDFIYGPLGNEETQKIVPYVMEKIKNFKGTIIFTKDTHHQDYLDKQEGKNLPIPHCIADSNGWELIDGLEEIAKKRNFKIYNKETFGSVWLAKDLKSENSKQEIESIEFIGVCTSICVLSNALLCKAYLPEVPLIVDKKCCACVTPESHNAALTAMKMSQIKVIK